MNAFTFGRGMQVKKDGTKDEITRVAGEAYDRGEFDALSMRALAAKVGMTPANLYTYFASKEDLFYALMVERQAKRLETLYREMDRGVSGRDMLERYARAYLAYARREPEELRKGLEWFVRGGDAGKISPEVERERDALLTRLTDRFLGAVRLGMKDGTIDPSYDPVEIMKVFTMTLRIVLNEVAVLKMEGDALFETFLDAMLGGFGERRKK
jgi:AcrR family transcriptional regulator